MVQLSIEFFCSSEPTLTFGAQFRDSSAYCFFGEKCEYTLSLKGDECHWGQLL